MARRMQICMAVLGAVAWLSACAPSARPAAAWKDPSPHRVSFVAVAPGVRLEVLDWGGSGPPLVLLAGLGNTGHVFDDFAPRLTGDHHVLAVTRRGYGASSQPATGYDITTRVADLASVLDSLHLGAVSLAGHSAAGDELTVFAGAHPGRVTRLVYLDAAYDHSDLARQMAGFPPAPPMTSADSSSAAAFSAYTVATYGMRLPEAEIRATHVFDVGGRLLRLVTPDSISVALLRGTVGPRYAAVRVPALAIYAPCDSTRFAYWARLDAAVRDSSRAFLARTAAWCRAQVARFTSGVRRSRVVELPGANHYVFLSDPDTVAAAMRAFLEAAGQPHRTRR